MNAIHHQLRYYFLKPPIQERIWLFYYCVWDLKYNRLKQCFLIWYRNIVKLNWSSFKIKCRCRCADMFSNIYKILWWLKIWHSWRIGIWLLLISINSIYKNTETKNSIIGLWKDVILLYWEIMKPNYISNIH